MQRRLRVEKARENHIRNRAVPKLLNIRMNLSAMNSNEKIVAEEYENAQSSVVINPVNP